MKLLQHKWEERRTEHCFTRTPQHDENMIIYTTWLDVKCWLKQRAKRHLTLIGLLFWCLIFRLETENDNSRFEIRNSRFEIQYKKRANQENAFVL